MAIIKKTAIPLTVTCVDEKLLRKSAYQIVLYLSKYFNHRANYRTEDKEKTLKRYSPSFLDLTRNYIKPEKKYLMFCTVFTVFT